MHLGMHYPPSSTAPNFSSSNASSFINIRNVILRSNIVYPGLKKGHFLQARHLADGLSDLMLSESGTVDSAAVTARSLAPAVVNGSARRYLLVE